MNDAEFRRRAHAALNNLIDVCPTCYHFRESGVAPNPAAPLHSIECEIGALLADGAAHRTCDCAYPPAHRPDCPDHGRMWPAVNIDLPPARKD